MKEVKLEQKHSKENEPEITEYQPHALHLTYVISLAEIECFTGNQTTKTAEM